MSSLPKFLKSELAMKKKEDWSAELFLSSRFSWLSKYEHEDIFIGLETNKFHFHKGHEWQVLILYILHRVSVEHCIVFIRAIIFWILHPLFWDYKRSLRMHQNLVSVTQVNCGLFERFELCHCNGHKPFAYFGAAPRPFFLT